MSMFPGSVVSVYFMNDRLDNFVLSLRVRNGKMFQFDITVDARCGPVGRRYEFSLASGSDDERLDGVTSGTYLDLSGNSEILRLSLASTLVLPTM